MALRMARPVLLNSWINWTRAKAKVARVLGHSDTFWEDVRQWLDEHAAGRSFVDIGTMWGDVWGAFDAEERGASPVTALDVTPPTDACLAEQEQRGTHTRFVTGDLHDVDVLEQVGVHDIVLCSGVLYHCPNPCLTLERLRRITNVSGYLLLGTKALQEVPGIPQACVFYPALTDQQRLAFGAAISGLAEGLHTRFDAALDYNNFWWGISRSALRAILEATGWEVVEQKSYRAALGYHVLIIARPDPAAASVAVPGSRTANA
jgi:2-polyprenyl-3-methyl-5-hydroxy-6-metoxy-1,4-benzoquinol methylase